MAMSLIDFRLSVRQKKTAIFFQAEGPLAGELKEAFQGSDFPSCQIMMLPYHLAVKYLVACPKKAFLVVLKQEY